MKSRKIYYWLALALGLLLFSRTNAQTQATPDTIITDGRYLMGDRDSKADAREFALLDAKKKILERAGTFVKSQDVVQNYQLTSQQIESYTLGTIQTEILNEQLLPNGSTFEMVLKVRGVINPQEVRELLEGMQGDSEMSSEIVALQQNYAALAAQLDSLKTQNNGDQTKGEKTENNRIGDLKRTELLMQFVTEAGKKKPALGRLERIVNQIPPAAAQRKVADGYLGIGQYKNAQYAQAIKSLQGALEVATPKANRRHAQPGQPATTTLSLKQQATFHYYLALSYQKTGNRKVALRHLKLAQKLNPQDKRYNTELK